MKLFMNQKISCSDLCKVSVHLCSSSKREGKIFLGFLWFFPERKKIKFTIEILIFLQLCVFIERRQRD